jgi:hypothetical protein
MGATGVGKAEKIAVALAGQTLNSQRQSIEISRQMFRLSEAEHRWRAQQAPHGDPPAISAA